MEGEEVADQGHAATIQADEEEVEVVEEDSMTMVEVAEIEALTLGIGAIQGKIATIQGIEMQVEGQRSREVDQIQLTAEECQILMVAGLVMIDEMEEMEETEDPTVEEEEEAPTVDLFLEIAEEDTQDLETQ